MTEGVWFWYAERTEETNYTQCSDGIVTAVTAQEAYDLAQKQARSDLNGTWEFVIKQFNKVN